MDQKFKLFKGVFGASDEVLGSIESGVDFEKRIAQIYQTCRTEEEINSAFDNLQTEMDQSIQSNLSDSRQKLLENFDAEVHEKLRINKKESQMYLDTYERWLWDITQYFLGENADFSTTNYSFTLKKNPFPEEAIDSGPYKIGKNIDDAHIYRPGHPLAQRILNVVKNKKLDQVEIIFDYSNNKSIISILSPIVGKAGVLTLSKYTVDALETEDNLIISAFDDNEEIIKSDIIKKLFKLSALSINSFKIEENIQNKLNALEQKNISFVSAKIAEKNSDFFEHEVDKLDKWSDDVKTAIELDLKRMDIDLKTAKTNAKKILNLEEKLSTYKTIKDMEKKRNEMRRKLFETQDNVDLRKEELITSVESRLKQSAKLETLFTIKWKVI